MKYVLVTGAYGGMRYATAKRLTESGYTVFALDKKDFKADYRGFSWEKFKKAT